MAVSACLVKTETPPPPPHPTPRPGPGTPRLELDRLTAALARVKIYSTVPP